MWNSIKNLSTFLKESDGMYSSTRLFMLLVAISLVVDWQHAVWTVGTWKPEWQTIATALGVLGFKVVKDATEKP